MRRKFSSEPASQNRITRKNTRKSCAVPGISRSSLGRRRSMVIWRAPADVPGALLSEGLEDCGRSFFSKPIRPPLCCPATYLPMRVSCMTSGADMMHTMASQCSRRACKSASTGRK